MDLQISSVLTVGTAPTVSNPSAADGAALEHTKEPVFKGELMRFFAQAREAGKLPAEAGKTLGSPAQGGQLNALAEQVDAEISELLQALDDAMPALAKRLEQYSGQLPSAIDGNGLPLNGNGLPAQISLLVQQLQSTLQKLEKIEALPTSRLQLLQQVLSQFADVLSGPPGSSEASIGAVTVSPALDVDGITIDGKGSSTVRTTAGQVAEPDSTPELRSRQAMFGEMVGGLQALSAGLQAAQGKLSALTDSGIALPSSPEGLVSALTNSSQLLERLEKWRAVRSSLETEVVAVRQGQLSVGSMPNSSLLNSALSALDTLAASVSSSLPQGTVSPVAGHFSGLEGMVSAVSPSVAHNAGATPISASSTAANTFITQLEIPVQAQQWSSQVQQRVVWLTGQGIAAADIMLNPPELGPLHVRIDQRHDQATVVFSSQHAQVREALEQSLPRLRDLFSASGLELLDVDVSDPGQRDLAGQGELGQESGDKSEPGEPSGPAQAEAQSGAGVTADAQRVTLHYGLVDAYA